MVPQYVENVLSKFESVSQTPSGWKAKCPSHNDQHPSLRVTIGQGGRVLVNCRSGCEYKDVLAAVGLTLEDLFPHNDDVPAEPMTVQPVPLSDEDAQFRDKVYRKLLHHLFLNNEHKHNLLNRGLSEHEIKQGNYKSLCHIECVTVPALLYEEFKEALFTVPGFVKGEAGNVRVPDHCVGLLVPVYSAWGKVAALKSRRTNIEPKYMYLSSPEVNPGCPCHVPRNVGLVYEEVIRVTEGELKAHVATYLSKTKTIGIAGVAAWQEALPVLASLKPKKVLVAMDWQDVQAKKAVTNETLALMESLGDLGYEVGLETWEEGFKGVDDVLRAGNGTSASWGKDALDRVTNLWKEVHGLITNTFSCGAPPKKEEREPLPFPVDVFPQAIRDYVEKASEQHQTPPDWLGGGVLVTAGRALGTTRSILLDDGYEEMGNLFMVVVGSPGTLKTTSMRAAVHPLLRRQKRLNQIYKEESAYYRQYLKEKKAAKEAGDVPPPEVQPPKPLEHVYTINITNEALVDRLAKNGDIGRNDTSILIFSDELKAWIGGMNQYRGGKGADKEFFLSGWSRTQYKGDRKGNEESVTIECPFVCVYGAIQPDVLPSIESSRGVEDGFIDRLLFLFPNAKRSYRPPKDRPRPTKQSAAGGSISPLEAAKLQYDAVIFRLLLGCRHLADDEPRVLEFTEGAWQQWLKWVHNHADETDAVSVTLRGVWSKLRAYAGRFALILHMLRVACGEAGQLDEDKQNVLEDGLIDEQDVTNAVKLVDYFKAHYKDVAAQFSYGPEDRKVQELIDWAVKHHGGLVPVRELYYPTKRFGCKGKADAEKLCRIAVDRNLGSIEYKQWPGEDGKKKETLMFLVKGGKAK